MDGRDQASDGKWKIKGWALKEKPDEEREAEKRGEQIVELSTSWSRLSYPEGEARRAVLGDDYTT